MALTDTQLKTLLEPFIPATRQAVLPEEKPSKLGLATRVMRDVMRDPKIFADIQALKTAYNQGTNEKIPQIPKTGRTLGKPK